MPFLYPFVGRATLVRPTSTLGVPLDALQVFGEPVTFTLDALGVLRLAPRRSEHVECAGALSVLAAGELVLATAQEISWISNQSTGFCPDVDSWAPLVAVLDRRGVRHPSTWSVGFHFRRCVACAELNLAKSDWACAFCLETLPEAWNVSDRTWINE